MPNLTSLVRHLSALNASDGDLLRSLAANPHGPALSELIRRYSSAIQQTAADICPLSAEDITQAVFVLLVQKAESIAAHDYAIGWLFETTRRLALKARIAATRRNRHERQAILPQSPPDPLNELSLREARLAVLEELSRLPQGLQEPLLLCYWEGTTQPDGATRLGCSLSTFKRRLDRGRGRLEARLVRRGFTGASVLAAMAVSRTSAKPIATSLMEDIVKEASSRSPVAAILAESAKGSLAGKVVALSACVFMVGIGLVYALAPQAEPQPIVEAKQPTEKTPVVAKVKADIYGDPLPEGAVARLGTERFRSEDWVSQILPSQDGKYLFGAGWNAIIQWDSETGKEVRRLEAPGWETRLGNSVLQSMAISPDGLTIAVCLVTSLERNNPIELFEVSSGKHLGKLQPPDLNLKDTKRRIAYPPFYYVNFITPDMVVTSNFSTPPVLWDVKKREVIRELEAGPNTIGYEWHFPNDDRQSFSLLSMDRILGTSNKGNKGFWSIWDLKTGRLLQHTSVDNLVSHVVTPDKKKIVLLCAVRGSHNQVRVLSDELNEIKSWKVHISNDESGTTFRDFLRPRNEIAISPSGKTIATRGMDFKVKQWNIDSGKEVGTPFQAGKYSLSISYINEHRVATAGYEYNIEIWDAKTGQRMNNAGPDTGQGSVEFSADGKYLATADRTIRIWEMSTNNQVAILDPKCRSISALKWIPNTNELFYTADSKAMVSDWKKDSNTQKWDNLGSNIVLSPDHRWIAEQIGTAMAGYNIRISDYSSGKEIRQFAIKDNLNRLIVSNDGKSLFGCGKKIGIIQWNVETGKEDWQIDRTVLQRTPDQPYIVQTLANSPGGQWLYSFADDNLIHIWEAKTGRHCKSISQDILPEDRRGPIQEMALSPDGNTLVMAICNSIGQVFLHCWDVPTGQVIATFKSHRKMVLSLSFSADSKYLASSGSDTSVLIWERPPRRGLTANVDKITEALWPDLASADVRTCYDATCRAVASESIAVKELRKQLLSRSPVDANKVKDLVNQLDSPKFAEREKASAALMLLDSDALPFLKKAISETTSEEVRSRLQTVLDRFETYDLRLLRSVEILEMINNDESRKLLGDLVREATRTDLKAEATQALKRLEQRRTAP
jgi:RNA polymerase sigma factor (sigma-70 family)